MLVTLIPQLAHFRPPEYPKLRAHVTGRGTSSLLARIAWLFSSRDPTDTRAAPLLPDPLVQRGRSSHAVTRGLGTSRSVS